MVRSPSLLQAPTVCRAELDCKSRPTMTVSGSSDMVRARRNSRLRSLLPPSAMPVRSSRLMKMRGPPSVFARFGASSNRRRPYRDRDARHFAIRSRIQSCERVVSLVAISVVVMASIRRGLSGTRRRRSASPPSGQAVRRRLSAATAA